MRSWPWSFLMLLTVAIASFSSAALASEYVTDDTLTDADVGYIASVIHSRPNTRADQVSILGIYQDHAADTANIWFSQSFNGMTRWDKSTKCEHLNNKRWICDSNIGQFFLTK